MQYWFIFQNEKLLLTTSNEHKLPTSSLPTEYVIRQHYLGHFNNVDCYCAELKDIPLPKYLEPYHLKKALEFLGHDWFLVASKAYSIITWDKNHHYCGRCGGKTNHTKDQFEKTCPQCGLFFYPRISPSIIVLIRKGRQLLMSRGHHFLPGVYGLIAGFVEAGESLEEAIHREVKEEVNLEVTNLKYICSQPWPFPDSLMMGFMADYASGTLRIDPHEIESADWYTYDALPGRPSKMSIAGKLIDLFISEEMHKDSK